MLEIRLATIDDAAGLSKVHIDTWRTTYTGIVPQAHLDSFDYKQRADRWREILITNQPRSHNLVSTLNGTIVGFVSGGESRTPNTPYESEIYALYLLKEYQGRGFGKLLFNRSVTSLIASGFSSTMLWVLKDNPTVGFYQAMGGKLFDEQPDEIGGVKLTESAYGWDQLKK